MRSVTLRELKQEINNQPEAMRFHAQLDQCLQKTTKTGNPFFEVAFADAEERLLLRVWNNTPMFATCPQLRNRSFYEVSGEFGLGNDGRSVDSKGWTVRALNEAEAAEVLAGSLQLREKQLADLTFIQSTVGYMSDPRLRLLCERFLDQFGERFQRTGAARGYHHARRGGLVEHVAQMMRTAVQICEAYRNLNRDLLVAGVLFHDIGKLWENAYQRNGFTMPYTEISELIGHISLGMEIVNKLWREIEAEEGIQREWVTMDPPTDRVRLHLLHLIVSHHGELEFGSPVVPKTPEAQALHYIDNLDAKMEMFARGYEVAGELAENVFERVRPLNGNLVTPLRKFPAAEQKGESPVEVSESGGSSDRSSPPDSRDSESESAAAPTEEGGAGPVEDEPF